MRNHRLILLAAGLVLSPAASHCEPFSLLSAQRMVAYDPGHDGPYFEGVNRSKDIPVLLPSTGTGSADRFRHDVIVIWSGSTGSRWYLLPPKFLGLDSRRPGPDAAPSLGVISVSDLSGSAIE